MMKTIPICPPNILAFIHYLLAIKISMATIIASLDSLVYQAEQIKLNLFKISLSRHNIEQNIICN